MLRIVDSANLFFKFRSLKYTNFSERWGNLDSSVFENFLKDYKEWISMEIANNKNDFLLFVKKSHSLEIFNDKDLIEFKGKCKFYYITIDWEKIDTMELNKNYIKYVKQYDDLFCYILNRLIENYGIKCSILSNDKFRDIEITRKIITELNININIIFKF